METAVTERSSTGVSGRHLIKNGMATYILSILYDCLLHKYKI
jgi:hypothetical protein